MKKLNVKCISLLFTVLFVILAFVSGTYGWQSEQQVINNLSGAKTKLMSVDLVKLEKHSDGTISETPIPDTVFYLFKSSGKQVGGRYITDENGKINVSLPLGEYYFDEVSPSIGYTYDKDKSGNPITKYQFTVKEQKENIVVKAYNIKLKGDLLIRNTVKNTDASPLTEEQKKLEFTFTVTFSDNKSYKYQIDNGEEKTLKSGETIKLCDGQTVVFQDLPVGVLYNVTETPIQGYICETTGHRGNITIEQSVANFLNYYEIEKMGKLIVTKDVIGGNDKNKEFAFTAKIGDKTENFTLKSGEFKSFIGIPLGTDYVVSEQTAEGYISSVKEYTGEIVNADEVILPFKNIYDASPNGKFGNITIKKQVKGNNSDVNKVFTYKVVFEGDNAPQEEIFSLKDGETKTFENIPYGVSYTVTETDANDYLPVLNTASGFIAGDFTAEVAFTNIVSETITPTKTTKLTVTKQLAGELLNSDKTKKFEMTLVVDNQSFEFTIKSGETKEFTIPVGAFYQLSEQDYYVEGFSQSIVNGSGISTEKPVNITVTNSYVGEVRTEIKGTKKWVMGKHTDVTLPKSITIQLKKGDLTIQEKKVVPNSKGEWKYTFVAPKYNQDGSLAEYTLKELPITSYCASYDGYNITNTYVPPVKADLPIITKSVQGDNAPDTTFEFLLKGKTNAPMPSGSEGNRKIVSRVGSGTVEMGSIIFTKSGKYVYTLYELNGKEACWKYDTTTYTVIFTVTENKNVLSCKREILKNNNTTDKVDFVNIYDDACLNNNIEISGTKSWNHGDNPKSKQPTSIIVYVYGDGELVAQRLVTSEDNWKYTFELPKYNDKGEKINYTIDEASVKNYSKQISGYNLINTYKGSSDKVHSTKSPLTGDYSSSVIWIVLIISMLGLVVSVLFYKKQSINKRNHHKN